MPTRSKILALGLSSAFLFLPTVVLAEYKLLEPTIVDRTGDVSSPGLGIYLGWLFNAFFAVVAIVTFIQIIITGVSYVTSAIPQVKAVAKDKMGQALFGFALALGAWLILNTISPGTFTNIDLSLENVVHTATGGGSSTPTNPPADQDNDNSEGEGEPTDNNNGEPGSTNPNEQVVRDRLSQSNIKVSGTEGGTPCAPGQTSGCTDVGNLKETTITGLEQIREDCPDCGLLVTAGSEAGNGHVGGSGYTHENGYKVDLQRGANLNNYIGTNFQEVDPIYYDGQYCPTYVGTLEDGTRVRAMDESATGRNIWDMQFVK